MKKIYLRNHNQILTDIGKEFEVVKIEEADVIVLWTDITSLERGIVNYAHILGKPVVVIQHGRKGSSRYFPPFSEPIVADRLCVWGVRDKKALVETGHPSEKIEVTGTTVFQNLVGREPHMGLPNIVFCPEHWDREVAENKKVKQLLSRLKGVNIITKLIEGHDPKDYQNPIQSDREKEDHLAICGEVLSTADLVVGISESTFELLAQSLDIPVVVMEEWYPKTFGGDERYYNYRRIISEASKKATFKNLLEVVENQLSNPGELREERKFVVEEEGGKSIDAIKAIHNVIESI